MMRVAIALLALLTATPAAAAVVREAPALKSPDGKLQVQFLVGPNAPEGKNLAVNRLVIAPGGGVPPHVHELADEIVVMVAGRGVFTLDGKTERVQAGDTVFVPRGKRHAFAVEGPEPVTLLQVYEPAGPEERFKAWAIPKSPQP